MDKELRDYIHFADILALGKQFEIKAAEIIKQKTATYYEVPAPALEHNTHEIAIVNARKTAIYLIWKHMHLTSVQIGRLFNRDHWVIRAVLEHFPYDLQKDNTLLTAVTELEGWMAAYDYDHLLEEIEKLQAVLCKYRIFYFKLLQRRQD